MRDEPGPWECNTQSAVLTAVLLVLSAVLVSTTLGEEPLLQHASAGSRPLGGPTAEAKTAVEVSMMDTGLGGGVGAALGMAERAETIAEIGISQPPPLAPPPPIVEEESGRCPKGCSKRGTCNEELGRCECPLGWKGASCDEFAAPACKISDDYILPCTAFGKVLSCECKLQCMHYVYEGANMLFDGPCVNTTGAAANAYVEGPEELPQTYLNKLTDRAPWRDGPMSEHSRSKLTALASCPGSCSRHGWCINEHDKPLCRCFYGWRGLSCELPWNQYCPSGCQGKGTCSVGFCHCNSGYYGADCSLVLDPAGSGKSKLFWEVERSPQQLPPARPYVYIYELPAIHVAGTITLGEGVRGDFGRSVGYMLYDRLLSSRHRVSDPEKADYFFVPALGNRFFNWRYDVMTYVAQHWPYWNASVTPRHIWVGADDAGASAYFQASSPPSSPPPPEFTAKSVFLQHMGLNLGGNRRYVGCYAPLQDVVIPPEGIADFAHAPAPYYLDDDATETAPERTITLLFIGTIPPDEWHIPHNVRLEVQKHHGQRPGYLISEQRTEDYQRDLASSVFCLAPSGQGGGWGMRFGSAVVTGCIPVIVMDNSTEVFEELLPYDKFTVRVPEREIPRLHEILEAIQQQPGLVQAMQAELACVHQFFLWSSMVGTYGKENGQTDAFGALMEILRRRVDGEVGQWDTACGKTLDTLSDRVAPPIPCHKGGCHGSARMQSISKASGSHPAVWGYGGAACSVSDPQVMPPC